mmetsp:Transcript_5922/g.12325  ORF Transcript_5922/g.12325 Transcript_5922/m.12325 type:complete len:139 (-) Transcript_5922:325-741(-)
MFINSPKCLRTNKRKKIRRDNDDIKDLFKGDVLDMARFVASIVWSLSSLMSSRQIPRTVQCASSLPTHYFPPELDGCRHHSTFPMIYTPPKYPKNRATRPKFPEGEQNNLRSTLSFSIRAILGQTMSSLLPPPSMSPQ